MKHGDLLNALHRAEAALPHLLQKTDWQSKDVDDDAPRVERLWRPFDDGFRLLLHRIHPCATPLFHAHPWPSAVRLLEGRYEMAVGHGGASHIESARVILAPGSEYEMIDAGGWHSVAPLDGPCLSIMVTGPPWGSGRRDTKYELRPLSKDISESLLRRFQSFF